MIRKLNPHIEVKQAKGDSLMEIGEPLTTIAWREAKDMVFVNNNIEANLKLIEKFHFPRRRK